MSQTLPEGVYTGTTLPDTEMLDRLMDTYLESTSDDDRARIRETILEEWAALEARGPLRFDFGPHNWGPLYCNDAVTAMPFTLEATGVVEIPAFAEVFAWEVHHPAAEVFDANPTHGFEEVIIRGADDRVFAALVGDRKLQTVDAHFLITEADVARAQATYEQDLIISQQVHQQDIEFGYVDADEEMWVPEPPRDTIGGEALTDAGLRAAAGHPALTSLKLRSTAVTDAGLAEVIPTIGQLRILDIDSDQITGRFLTSLADHDALHAIRLSGAALDGYVINELPVMKHVQFLGLEPEHLYETLDPTKLRAVFPNVTELTIGGESAAGVTDDRLLPFVIAFPGISVNEMELSPLAVAKWAGKHGIPVLAAQPLNDATIPYAATMDELNAILDESSVPVLLDFTATWCGPCKALTPILDQLAAERDDFAIVKVDIDQNPDAADKYSIQGVPTMILVEAGDSLVRMSGAMPKHELETRLEPFI